MRDLLFAGKISLHSFGLGKWGGVADGLGMSDLVRVEPVALMPTQAGCAVFLGDGSKVIVFYIDPAVGAAINATLAGQKPPRPMTHDLFIHALHGFGAKISRMAIVAMEDEVYYARIIIEAHNELMDHKIIELDARPSDCLALAVRDDAPMFVVRQLWDRLEDMSQALEDLRNDDGPPNF